MAISGEADVVAVRQRARLLAELLGFDRQDQTRIATAVSEIARNALSYGGGGRARFAVVGDKPRPELVIGIEDAGPGIGDLDLILGGNYRSQHGLGLGVVGAKRLMDRFAITSAPGKGTQVELGQILPPAAGPLSRAKVNEIARLLPGPPANDPHAVLLDQNRELMASLQEIDRRDEETEKLNRELTDTNRGVVALHAELEERAEQLRQAGELKSRFFSNMSHEFRTPLNSIMALTRLLLDQIDGPLTREQEKQVGYIRRSTEDLLDIVNDLLDLAKVEAGKVELRRGRVNVPEIFGALRGALKPLQANPAVELLFDCDAAVPQLFTDEAKLSQILRNLISNALKFTEAGEVRVTARYDNDQDRVVFRVRDTGIGIAPENHARIFEEFGQIESRLQGRYKGTGLGLPLSRNLAELLGGEITVESVVGQGSVFSLFLPADVAGEARATAARAAEKRRRVLVIDDDETFRYVLRQLIAKVADCEIIDASDGEEGLRRARTDKPDLIMLDLLMPNLDGFSLVQQLDADPRTHGIPMVVSTSLALTPELRARLPAGIPLLPKKDLSRDNIAQFLRELAPTERRAS
jgi:signal transduction histidine kinase